MFEGQEEQQRKVLNRLKRARGQLDAVIAAVEGGAPCKNVITQLSATTSALNRAGFAIVSTAMKECVVDESGASAAVVSGEGVSLNGKASGRQAVPSGQRAVGERAVGERAVGERAEGETLTMDELEKLFMMLA